MAGNVSGDFSAAIAGIRITITYEEGPTTMPIATVTPSGGDVQPEQTITVDSDPDNPNPDIPYDPGNEYVPFDPLATNLIDLEYAAITDDGRVIPLIPQIISPYKVVLQFPPSSTQPCLDCLGDCPKCYEAFVPCDEDISSDECAAAMQECLDCLVECLEELQLAEECNESTGQPPDVPTTVIIVCWGGTQFSGRVTLGSFVILYANGSGLYRFTMGQKHDILYHGDRDGTTYNVKIPDPGGKTGFFRG